MLQLQIYSQLFHKTVSFTFSLYHSMFITRTYNTLLYNKRRVHHVIIDLHRATVTSTHLYICSAATPLS
ncbi:hypothetical protein XELAEV_18029341mg [Xenopus laevis]|uniref:Uncharacterized protein n=1 Tax=Xenopus laevis TaxID=8355 RepID=A0A974CRE9_XENLA|nr:hypothetical protein XELAEV_18029341mg [Xenopus laevis]